MEATFDGHSILLPNGVKYLRREGETDSVFTDRVSAMVFDDYCEDLEIEHISAPEPVEETPKDDNTGRVCSFTKRSTGDLVQGQIIWVYPDKRKNLTYYRVKDGSGKIHIVRVNNPTLKIL